MTIRYEANPPKILPGTDTDESISRFVDRIRIISEKCDAIHITENVLGHRRVSPVRVGRIIRDDIPDLPVTVSLRVRDKTEGEISAVVEDCISAGFAGILVLAGDPPQDDSPDSGQVPSAVVSRLREQGVDSRIDLYLSISNRPDFARIGKKLEAKPRGFMTQVVQDIGQVRRLHDGLEGFAVIPIVLFPSEKNRKSAEFVNLDPAEYGRGFGELLSGAHKVTGDVLVTSPNDFGGLCDFLDKRD